MINDKPNFLGIGSVRGGKYMAMDSDQITSRFLHAKQKKRNSILHKILQQR